MAKTCTFCDRKTYTDRIMYEDEFFVVVPSMGQLSPYGGHLLIIPKQCWSCIASFTDTEIEAFEKLHHKVRMAIQKTGLPPLSFEHGVVGQSIAHAHAHIVPANFQPLPYVRYAFPSAKIEVVRSYKEICETYGQGARPYLYWRDGAELPSKPLSYVCWNPPAPEKYFRILLAQEHFHEPRRADWRTCDPDEDRKLIRESMSRIKIPPA